MKKTIAAILLSISLAGCATKSPKNNFSCEQLRDAQLELFYELAINIEFRLKHLHTENNLKLSATQIERLVIGQIQDTDVSIKLIDDTVNLNCVKSPEYTDILNLMRERRPLLLEINIKMRSLLKMLNEI